MDNTYKGILKQWNEDKGFGFIRPENEKRDVFIHISALKNMSRRPIAGDVIFYQIHTDNNGKNRAVNARIEGVAITQPRTRQKNVATHKPNLFFKLIPLVLLIFAGVFVYNKFTKEDKLEYNSEDKLSEVTPVAATPVPKQQVNFKCDGRQHCSQMNSRAEAVFFIRNCPDTKMDGDNDGVPCENDSRF